MNKRILLQCVLLILKICLAMSELEVPGQINHVYNNNKGSMIENVNEKLDYNKVKMSKLRLLLLGELFRQKNDVPSLNLTCDSGSSFLYVNTKNCSCKHYSCKTSATATSNEINTNYNHHQRNVYTSCKDFCCTKFKRSVSNNLFNQLFTEYDNHKRQSGWQRVAAMCGGQDSFVTPYIMHRKGNEALCRGVLLSSKVILTTARCVYDTSLRDLIVKLDNTINEKYENLKLIRKMLHSNFRPEEGKNTYDVALLVLNKEIKTLNDGGYMCLPKVDNIMTNCHLTIPSHIHSYKIYLNLLKIQECDKLVQIPDFQKKLYFNNGSVCGVSSDDDFLPNDHMFGGSPLTCLSKTNNKIITSKDEIPNQKYFVQGLLTRYWINKQIMNAEQMVTTNKSAFAFVNVFQYVDWINMQMEKLYL